MTSQTEAARVAEELKRLAGAERAAYGEFEAAIAGLFGHCGLDQADTAMAVETVLYPQLCGSESHGVVTMPLYVTGLLDRTINPRPRSRRTQAAAATAVIDADNGLGLVESRKAMDLAMKLAAAHGVGAVAVRRSSHFGAAGYYSDLAARQGMIGLAMSNSAPAIAPTNGVTPLLGTNPIGVGVPVNDASRMNLDMATAVVARSRIRQMLAAGETTIPQGWAIDAAGEPTTDAAQAVAGSVLPIGDAKGYGLALMVELLCSALADGDCGFDMTYENVVKRPSNAAHFFLALDPAGFAGRDAFSSRAGQIAKRIEGSEPRKGSSGPRLPGARAQASRQERLSSGIVVGANLQSALRQTAGIVERYAAATPPAA